MGMSHRRAAFEFTACCVALLYVNMLLQACGGTIHSREDFLGKHRSELGPPQNYYLRAPQSFMDGEGKGFIAGATPLSFHVSNDGEARLSVPIWTSPGRAGVEPRLSLEYGSRGSNGLLGMGWQLAGLSRIERCGKSVPRDATIHAVDFSRDDSFCLDGSALVEVTPVLGGRPEFRTERDSFRKIVSFETVPGAPDSFEVRTKDGLILHYGDPAAQARLEGVRSNQDFRELDIVESSPMSAVTLAWALDRVTDRFGNYMTIEYQLSGDRLSGYEQLPVAINYTGHTALSSGFERRVTFEYENRYPVYKHASSSPFPSGDENAEMFVAGFKRKMTQRLKRIRSWGPPGLTSDGSSKIMVLRGYEFSYKNESVTGRSLLASVKECDGGGLNCKEPLVFSWELGQFQFKDSDTAVSGLVSEFGTNLPSVEALQVADLNGDGLDDILYRRPWIEDGKLRLNYGSAFQPNRADTMYGYWSVRLNTEWGFGPELDPQLPRSSGAGLDQSLMFADLDDDGMMEVLGCQSHDPSRGIAGGYYLASFNGSNFVYIILDAGLGGRCGAPSSSGAERDELFSDVVRYNVADLNGDGRPDLLRKEKDAPWKALLNQSTRPGDVQFASTYIDLKDGRGQGLSENEDDEPYYLPSAVTDIDRDGRADLLVGHSGRGFAAYSLMPDGHTREQVLSLSKLPWELSAQFSPEHFEASFEPCVPGDSRTACGGSPSSPWLTGFTGFMRLFLDVNGDGLPDNLSLPSAKHSVPGYVYDYGAGGRILKHLSGGATINDFGPRVAVNTGHGFASAGNWTAPDQRYHVSPSKYYEACPSKAPYYSQCSAVSACSGDLCGCSDFVCGEPETRPWDTGVRIADFNGDGRDDLLLVDDGQRYGINRTNLALLLSAPRGSGFQARSLPHSVGMPTGFWQGQEGGVGYRLSQTGDFNGDGLIDIIQVDKFSRSLHVLKRMGSKPDVIVGVSRRLQAPGVEFEYDVVRRGSAQAGAPVIVYPQAPLRKGMHVVRAMVVDGDAGDQNRYTYDYRDGRFDVRGRGWLGFARTTIYDEQTGATTTLEFDNATLVRRNVGDAKYYYPYAHLVKTKTTKVHLRGHHEVAGGAQAPDRSWKALERIVTTEFETVFGIAGDSKWPTYRVYPGIQNVVEYQEGVFNGVLTGRTPVRHEQRTTRQDDFGNAVYIEVRATEGTLGPGSPGETLVHGIDYFNDPGNWIIGLKDLSTTTSTVPATAQKPVRSVSRTIDWDWDYHKTGALEKVTVEPGSPEGSLGQGLPELNLKMEILSRDSFGNVTSVARTGSGKTETMTVEFDPHDHAFPTSITNSLNQVMKIYYHRGLGLPAVADDVSGLRTIRQYDRMGRIVAVDLPGVVIPTVSEDLEVQGSFEDVGPGGSTVYCDTVTPAGGRVAKECFDITGRVVREEWKTMDGSQAVKTYEYDRLGNLVSESLPYVPGSLALRVQHYKWKYDQLGRPLSRVRPGGGTFSWTYDGLNVYAVSEVGDRNEVERDALGRVKKTVGYDSHAVSTRFEYGPFSVLEDVFDPEGNRSSFQYDVLGRITLHSDPDAGDTWVSYDAFGRLKDSVDARKVVSEYEYDLLGRITKRSVGGRNDTWTWDETPERTGVIGRLAETLSRDGVRTAFHYDADGRPYQEDTMVDGAVFSVNYGYDGFGRVDQVWYPEVGSSHARLKLKYGYSVNDGSLSEISDITGGVGSSVSLWKALSRDASGRVTLEEFGNFCETKRTYDWEGRVESIETLDAKKQPLQRLSYGYGADGLLDMRSDEFFLTEKFEYDGLGRLKKWMVDQNFESSGVDQNLGSFEMEYEYSDSGNLLARTALAGGGQSESFGYGENGAGPHAVSSLTVRGEPKQEFYYDAAGNQTSAPDRFIEWNSFNLPSLIYGKGGDWTQFQYDADGKRALKASHDGDRTVYVSNLYERRVRGGAVTHAFYVHTAERRILEEEWDETAGSVSAARIKYLHDDRLGSPDAVSDHSGSLIGRTKFEPFGQRRSATSVVSGPVKQSVSASGFTGHQEDEEFGLINMTGRIYDPRVGRFLSVDPVRGGMVGQAWNRYSYVLNNPLSYVDPTGLIEETLDPDDPTAAANGFYEFVDGDGNPNYVFTDTEAQSEVSSASADDNGSRGREFFQSQMDSALAKAERVESEWFSDASLDKIQLTLDVVGLVPGFGEVADGANALISVFRGNYSDALLSVGAMVPFFGGFAIAGKLVKSIDAAKGGGTLVNRIGGAAVENLRLKPGEAGLNPPGISVLLDVDPATAARQMVDAFPSATRLHEAARTVGQSTLDRIRASGFDVIPDATKKFPNHGRIIHPDGAAGFCDSNLCRLSEAFSDVKL